ncbi:MAG: recombinase family protein [Anaerolineae bacterium]|jgi:site-specific DNA recombinase|nr:recombinase family protein [Anaerolineae bacterium]MBT4308949.1 recombinase family protein [Anaerolineae bacterium]MBT4459858.1 recombinase family protein [Anaerolineae bacterium]MBT6062031.1 recombinase family protein [Anaerolineae bacterium]MBT6321233.1 recombinase family protein [Anaerolineae bacterium]
MSLLSPPPTLPTGSLVDCYVRDSGGPTQERSTDQQIQEIQQFCNKHNLELRHIFSDVAKSGGSATGRDSFEKMLDTYRAPNNRPSGLLLWNYARFARDLDDSIYYKSLLKAQNITVHSLTDPVPDGHYGRIVELFIDISNEEKRRQTSTDAKRGLRDLVLNHGCVPGKAPHGFMRTPVKIGTRRDGTDRIAHRWEPDPKMLSKVREAFKMKAAGATLSQIHAKTRLYGSLNSYRTFFANKIYIGILHYGDETIAEYCDPIVDLQTWKTVQKVLEKQGQPRKIKNHPRRVNSPYLLSGLIYCDKCGSPLNGNTVTRKGASDLAYRCARAKRKAGCTCGRISAKTLEAAVFGTVKDYILLPDNLDAIHAITEKNLSELKANRSIRRKELGNERQSLSHRIANITAAIAETGHSQAMLDQLRKLEDERTLLIVESKEINAPIEPLENLKRKDFQRMSEHITKNIEKAPPGKARALLRGFIHKIRAQKIDNSIVGTITYFYPPNKAPPDSPAPTGVMLPIEQTPVGALQKKPLFSGFFDSFCSFFFTFSIEFTLLVTENAHL